MLDYKFCLEHLDLVAKKLKQRGFVFDSDYFMRVIAERKACRQSMQALQTERNRLSKAIGVAKQKGEEPSDLMEQAAVLPEQLKAQESRMTELDAAFEAWQFTIPNVPHDSVPIGRHEADNIEVRRWGEIPQFDYIPRDHIALGEGRGIDFKLAAQLSGARFVVLSKRFAQLHRALGEFMLDLHIAEGYEEVYVPYLLHEHCLYGTGQLPKFYEDQFVTSGRSKFFLIPTAEVPLMNLGRDTILEESDLPQQYVTQTACFRREAGSYGQDVQGMIRQHQFQKVEIVQWVKPSTSYEALESLTLQAEKILKLLELPYRVMALCTGDLGFAAAKTYDLEVWMPGQNRYREISSCSNCEDFQARRMRMRFRDAESGQSEYVHTLNGSALAVGRAFIAVIENYQEEDGRIRIPVILQPYMKGLEYF